LIFITFCRSVVKTDSGLTGLFIRKKVTVRQVRRVLKIVIYEAVLYVYNGITIRLISKGDICRIRVARKKGLCGLNSYLRNQRKYVT
jgi:hypothetical protein